MLAPSCWPPQMWQYNTNAGGSTQYRRDSICGMTRLLTTRRFVVLTVACAVWSTFAIGYSAFHTLRYGGQSKVQGWSAARGGGAWMVTSVKPSGPAAGKLLPGDRILAIDGIAAAAKIGPSWFLRDRPEQSSYTIDVDRGGSRIV